MTYLQLVNSVLRRLREDEEAYKALLGYLLHAPQTLSLVTC